MPGFRRFLPVALVILCAAPATLSAQSTFTDAQGRFAIDLPKGWAVDPPGEGDVLVFKGDNRSIIIEWVPGVNDPEQLMKKALGTLRASGLADPAPDGDVLELKVNGLPARWGVYQSAKQLASLTGAVAIGDNGLYFLSIVAQGALSKWKAGGEQAFRSIRAAGAGVAAATEVKAAPAAPAATATPWKGESISLVLPPGWVEKPRPRGMEKEVKGFFMNDELPGATLIVVVYKGFGMTSGKALDAGIKSMTIPMPGLKPVEAGEEKLEKRKASLVVLRGMAAGSGTEVELASVVVTVDAGGKFANLLLTGPAVLQPTLRSHALEIARTVD